MAKPESIFEPVPGDREQFVPTGYARGPWYDATQHGGPVIALLARAVDRHPADRPMQVVRLTVDLERAAPMAPVSVTVRPRREGKTVQFLDAELSADGEVMARARAMRMRIDAVPVGNNLDGWIPEPPPPFPETTPPSRLADDGEADAFYKAFEIRPVPGETPTAWFRMRMPLVAGEETSPFVRAAVCGDFTYSVPVFRQIAHNPRSLLERTAVAINPDTTLNVHRPPEGEWIGLDSRTVYDELGAGTAMAHFYDRRGPIGFATQSLLVRGVEARPQSWSEIGRKLS